MNYTTYLFDFDYTLADSSRGIVTCFRNVLTRHGYTCLQTQNAPAGLPHLQVIAPDALYLTWGGKQRTFTSFGKLLEEIK